MVGIVRQSCRLDVDRDSPAPGVDEHLGDRGRGHAVVGAVGNLNVELLDERQRRGVCGVATQCGKDGPAIRPQEHRDRRFGLFDLFQPTDFKSISTQPEGCPCRGGRGESGKNGFVGGRVLRGLRVFAGVFPAGPGIVFTKGTLICFLFARVGAGRTPANTRITRKFDALHRPTSDLVVAVIGGAFEAEAAFNAPDEPADKLGQLEAAEDTAPFSGNSHLDRVVQGPLR